MTGLQSKPRDRPRVQNPWQAQKVKVHDSAVITTRDAPEITIFPAGNDIDLKHRITIVIFNIFFKF